MQNCLEKFTLKAYILLLLRFFCFCFLCYVFACVFFCLLPWWQNHHKICCQPVLLLTDWKKFIKTSKMLQLLLSPFSRQLARYWNQLQACGAVIKQSLGSSVVFFFPVFTISPWDHVMALFLPALTIWSMCSRRSNISVNHLQVYIKSLTSFSIANDIAILKNCCQKNTNHFQD